MSQPIPQDETDRLLAKIREFLLVRGMPKHLVDTTTLVVIHPDTWEVSLFVPYEGMSGRELRKITEKVLFADCGVERQCCDYLGRRTDKKACEWYFRHPNIPQDIYEMLEMRIEKELGEEVGMGLPSPNGFKSKTDMVFLSLTSKYFDEIASGIKTEEFRSLNQYYCDKFFSPGIPKKYVKFNRGYESGPQNQMTFEIDGFYLVSDKGVAISAFDEDGKVITSYGQLPSRFAPEAYMIRLGKRIV